MNGSQREDKAAYPPFHLIQPALESSLCDQDRVKPPAFSFTGLCIGIRS